MIVASMVVGIVWIIVLRNFARYIVWGTVITVPFFTIGMFVWTLVESFQGNRTSVGRRDPQDTGLTVLSIVPLLLGMIHLLVIYQQRDRIQKTITVIESPRDSVWSPKPQIPLSNRQFIYIPSQLACEILKKNPEMLMVSFGILLVFLVFTVVWLVFFSRLWLVGHPSTPGTGGGAYLIEGFQITCLVSNSDYSQYRNTYHFYTVIGWVVEENIWPLVVFFALVYLWTTAILRNIQRLAKQFNLSAWPRACRPTERECHACCPIACHENVFRYTVLWRAYPVNDAAVVLCRTIREKGEFYFALLSLLLNKYLLLGWPTYLHIDILLEYKREKVEPVPGVPWDVLSVPRGNNRSSQQLYHHLFRHHRFLLLGTLGHQDLPSQSRYRAAYRCVAAFQYFSSIYCLFVSAMILTLTINHCLHLLMYRPDYETNPLHRFHYGRSDLGLWYFHFRDALTELTLWLYRGHSGYDRAALCVAVLFIHYDERVTSFFLLYPTYHSIDATFMCYAIDLDHNKVHSRHVHDAFAGPGFSQ
ncbi:LOW QUALITY PROTEIN: hypothetical protein BC937DRAFT_94718 [Endogone sp. FLAS-F59071]|nr:LOW QUALITY PROTEIN: hypothetical protein BC937DRAFT_94718 [Endogone sp. FLAS-F59071]|eukprot:RUS13818.1 LOW QUALITY PROTEIN: hypothetical protein BC937DRAFT_94718 [Endogone sp. FLAS-F59071]